MIKETDDSKDFEFSNHYGFRYREITTEITPEEQMSEVYTLTHNAIFLQLEGELHITWGEFKDVVVRAGDIYFLPRGANVSAYMVGKTIKYIAARLEHSLDNESAFRELVREKENRNNYDYSFTTVPIKAQMKNFVESVKTYIVDGKDSPYLHTIKFAELYIIFNNYYSREECFNLFYPIVKYSSKFKTFILDNYCAATSIEKLVEKANMSRSTFDRKFKEAFDTTPLKWINEQTRQLIIRKTAEPNVAIKDIMYEVGVYNSSQFSTLCKRLCGVTPSQLIRSK